VKWKPFLCCFDFYWILRRDV